MAFDPAARDRLIQDLSGIALACQNPISDFHQIPDRRKVILMIKDLQSLMFPLYFQESVSYAGQAGDVYRRAYEGLVELIGHSLPFFNAQNKKSPEDLACQLLAELPRIKQLLADDALAICQGDPAANSCEEVLICYPGFYAISIHRLAHALYLLDVPLLPRIMAEFAHEKTGIDIHPGASIGQRFCIDHGTGIVIGQTAQIGDDVKMYQGVTLGARSFKLDEQGNPVKGGKRHPSIGNKVVIYAGAVILGGDTRVGDNSVIGGNVWLTHSVPEGSLIYYDGDRVVAQPPLKAR